MSHHIDPRLATSSLPLPPPPAQHGENPPPPVVQAAGGARINSLRAESGAYAYSAQQSPQPYYYHYPTPPVQTPQQRTGPTSAGSQSNQASPHGVGAYRVPADAHDPSPDEGHHDIDGDGEGQDGDDPKRPRACESCRGLKVRCDQDPAHPEISCKRCAKAGRPCVITQPSRKRQKKADSRVAELEKKLDALTAALQQQHQQQQQQQGGGGVMMHFSDQSSPARARPLSADQSMPPQKRRRTEDRTVETYSGDRTIAAIKPDPMAAARKQDDSALRGIHEAWAPTRDLKKSLHHTTPEEFVNRINSHIPPDVAIVLFDRYLTQLSPILPAITFPPGTTAEQVFKEKPILYTCILAAASFGTVNQDATLGLAREAIGAIADCVVRNGAKSVELIQAMQVTALWYRPPEQAEQTNFYQIIHMAAVMALDIGLGKRFNPAKARRGFGGPNAKFAPGPTMTLPQDSDTLEARRAWLCCYYLCASASMVLRRPNLVRWTNYMKECIEVLETHPDAYPSDKVFCQHVKIQHICEDIGLQFLMDDNTANISITDPKVTYALTVLETQLKSWKENIPLECRGPVLTFFEHVTSLYLHEIALHFNHNIEDFRLPFTEESLKSAPNTSDTLTQNQMAALEACLKAAHGILDIMLAFDTESLKSLPMLLFFARSVYAIVILIKMHVAVCAPSSELGRIMSAEQLRVEYYLDGLIGLLGSIGKAPNDFRPPSKMLRILGVLRDWFTKHKEGVEALSSGDANVQHNGTGPAQRQRHPHQQGKTSVSAQYSQTPLHLLSQVATSDNQSQQLAQQDTSSGPQAEHDWTFSSATVIDYSKLPAPGHPDSRFPMHAQDCRPQVTSASMPPATSASNQGNDFSMPLMQQQPSFNPMVDPTNLDYGWGSGFEQAMDIALGGMDGLQDGSLDNWLLGDGLAPFAGMGDLGGPASSSVGGAGTAQW